MNFYIIGWAIVFALAISGIHLIFCHLNLQLKREDAKKRRLVTPQLGDIKINETSSFLIGILLLLTSINYGVGLWHRY